MAFSLSSLQGDLNTALKAGQAVRVATLRMLVSAVRNAAIDTYGAAWETSITEADIINIAKKQVKTHKESVEAFQKAGRADLAEKEVAELVILEEYAPKELSDDELKVLLAPIAQIDEKNFGLLMKSAMAVVKGQADGGRVSAILKQLTSSK
jgi:uncharacterized protein YqeY